MKFSLSSLSLVVALGVVAFACADSQSDASEGPPDGSTGLPAQNDAGTIDPPADAAPDQADVVVPPKVCSDQNFCHLPVPAGSTLNTVWGDGTGTVWTASTEGNILRFDATNGWKVHQSGVGEILALWGSGPNDVWAGGDKGVYRYTGTTFAESVLPGTNPTHVTSLWGTAANDLYATGYTENDKAEQVYVLLHWNGTDWSVETTPGGIAYDRVWGHAGAGVWISGYRPLPPPDDLQVECVVLRRGSTDTEFSEIALPKDEEYDGPFFSTLGQIRGASAPTSTMMWIFSRSLSTSPNVMKGVSADNGATFTWTSYREERLAARPANAVYAVSANDAWAVGEYGLVQRWDGTEWKSQQITLTKLPVTKPFRGVWATTDRAYLVGVDIALEWRKP
jgi:hypothetical protein